VSTPALTADALQHNLIAALSLTQTDTTSFTAPYFSEGRGVVFGGQLLGQAIVAAARTMPAKRVKSAQMVFSRGVSVADPVDIVVEPMHQGRNIGSATVSFVQGGRVCARTLVLLDVPEPDLVSYQLAMPSVDAPDPAKAIPHALTAPETIVVGDVDIHDPALTGPPTLQLWVRFAQAPDDGAIQRALIAHTTDGWLIATAMRPHPNLGQSMAHVEVSTGVLTQSLSFHGEVDARQWLLIDHHAQATGGGRTYGRGHIFTEDGRLIASFVQEALLRRFPEGQDPLGKAATIF
jgi:acyl-CoA thioesterase II